MFRTSLCGELMARYTNVQCKQAWGFCLLQMEYFRDIRQVGHQRKTRARPPEPGLSVDTQMECPPPPQSAPTTSQRAAWEEELVGLFHTIHLAPGTFPSCKTYKPPSPRGSKKLAMSTLLVSTKKLPTEKTEAGCQKVSLADIKSLHRRCSTPNQAELRIKSSLGGSGALL